MKYTWFQANYGKPITEPEGPIKKGSEHHITGASPDIPEALLLEMSAQTTGIGNSDQTNWREFTWNKEGGGLVVRVVHHDGVPYVIAGKIRGRPESGERRLGRMYVQAHYMCTRASDTEFPFLMALHHHLQASPQLVGSPKDLDTIPASCVDISLPDNWLALITPLIRVLLSNQPLSIKTTKRSMDEMVQVAYIVQCALPHTLGWRMTMRIGALSNASDDAVFSFVEKVDKMPRMIGFSMTDSERNLQKMRDCDDLHPYPGQEDRAIAEKYLAYLAEHASSCTTTQELRGVVARDFEHFSEWDALDPSWSFTKAGREFLQALFEDDGIAQLKEALNGNGSYPPIAFFVYRKHDVVESLLPFVQEKPDFVLKTIRPWSTIWTEVLHKKREEYGYLDLLVPDLPIDPTMIKGLERSWNEQYIPVILRRLDSWFSDIRTSVEKSADFPSMDVHECLKYLVEQYDSFPRAIQEWIQAREMFLSICFRYRMENPTIVESFPTLVWFGGLSSTGISAVEDIVVRDEILDHHARIQERFVDDIYSYNLSLVVHWIWSSRWAATDQGLLADALRWKQDGSVKDLSEALPLLRHGLEHNPSLLSHRIFVQSLASHYFELRVEEQEQAWETLQSQTPPFFAQHLFEKKGGSRSSSAVLPTYVEHCIAQYRAKKSKLRTVFVDIAHAYDEADSFVQSSLIDLGKRLLDGVVYSGLPMLLQRIQRGSSLASMSVKDTNASHVSFWMHHLRLTWKVAHIEDNYDLLLLYVQTKPDIFVPSVDVLKHLQSLDASSPQWADWSHVISQLGWESEEGWRLIFASHDPKRELCVPSQKEEEMMLTFSLVQQIDLLSRGFFFSETVISTYGTKEFMELEEEQLGYILWYAVHTENKDIQQDASRAYIVQLSEKEKEKLKSDVSGFFSQWAQSLEDLFSSKPSHLPEAFPCEEWVKDMLLRQSKDVRLSWFV